MRDKYLNQVQSMWFEKQTREGRFAAGKNKLEDLRVLIMNQDKGRTSCCQDKETTVATALPMKESRSWIASDITRVKKLTSWPPLRQLQKLRSQLKRKWNLPQNAERNNLPPHTRWSRSSKKGYLRRMQLMKSFLLTVCKPERARERMSLISIGTICWLIIWMSSIKFAWMISQKNRAWKILQRSHNSM